ncbi:uracil phosphoribosyltransferase [Marinihelvus fidelis]|uniref:Uracil phosphoribosyltransferase n=1 Tax=Marinihelvus fidelis TaxID=2613842 RepID=A0A5N0TE47_9GAMM|nr:uracil phosphoribosyltransferase [Marinihelvus fidelis]KAA9133373.1 uracil phosphoribosyltransferase [Marinihelvus fidelis]
MAVELVNLGQRPSLVTSLVAELRDTSIQHDPLRFRRNIERIGEIFAYEISKRLEHVEREVQTPLGLARPQVLARQPVLATVLRAGLPLHQGLLNAFDRADNAFVSAYRRHDGDETSFEVEIEYLASPSLKGRTLLLCDPMLATGTSMMLAWKALLARGEPAELHVVCVLASQAGVDAARRQLPDGATLWVAAIDPDLDERAYIVPGLGDAGDLAYGTKL